jgi:hypothetical protein
LDALELGNAILGFCQVTAGSLEFLAKEMSDPLSWQMSLNERSQ